MFLSNVAKLHVALSILRNGRVALSILRIGRVALSILALWGPNICPQITLVGQTLEIQRSYQQMDAYQEYA